MCQAAQPVHAMHIVQKRSIGLEGVPFVIAKYMACMACDVSRGCTCISRMAMHAVHYGWDSVVAVA